MELWLLKWFLNTYLSALAIYLIIGVLIKIGSPAHRSHTGTAPWKIVFAWGPILLPNSGSKVRAWVWDSK